MAAGQSFTRSWNATDATALTHACSASGYGYTVNEALPVDGSAGGTASDNWAGFPSNCTWTANGPRGSASFAETMTTDSPDLDEITYIHTDALGSPVARTDASGTTIVSRTGYEPYGLTASGVTPTIGFTGHVNDADTGLVYMQQRYYDPVAGRFLSIDPVVTDANTGTSFNRYAYANNSPYKYIDPDGRDPGLPSFFRLTTFEAMRSDTTLEQAVQRGELTRNVTLPTIAAAASPSAVGVAAAAVTPAAVATGEVVTNQVMTRKGGLATLRLLQLLNKVENGPKPPSLPKLGNSAIQKVVKEIKANSQAPKPQKTAPPPPPPPEPPKVLPPPQ